MPDSSFTWGNHLIPLRDGSNSTRLGLVSEPGYALQPVVLRWPPSVAYKFITIHLPDSDNGRTIQSED